MATGLGATRFVQIGCDVYTQTTRTSGALSTLHNRFSDALNAVDQDFLLLRNVSTAQFGATRNVAAAHAMVRRESVLLAVPKDAMVDRELAPAQQALYVDKRRVQVLIDAYPFQIEGAMHLPPEVELLQYAHEPFRPYVPITGATVTHISNPSLSFQAGFVMVNRKFIDVLVDMAVLDKTELLDPEETPISKALEVKGLAAAELLAASSIFEKVNRAELEHTCGDLIAKGMLTRLQVPAGVEIIRQGDMGKALYFIEDGSFEVLRISGAPGEAPQRLATLSFGEYAGEMAMMGDGRRNATVKAVEDSTVLVVDAEAMKRLMTQFPSATSALLKLMVEREGGRTIAPKRLNAESTLAERLAAHTPAPRLSVVA